MRTVACAGALSLLSAWTPARAQEWAEYAIVPLRVALQFPAAPTQSAGVFTTASGASVPQTVFSLTQGSVQFTLTVVDFTGHGGEQGAAERQSLKALRDAGGVRLDVDECISGQDGRELSMAGADGSQSKRSVFSVGSRLYLLEAKASPPDVDSGAVDTVRFQQSMRFSGGPLGSGPSVQPICRGRAREASTVD
jgi:hypothetical protein